ncbi:MAG: 4Fe-4S binding protein [Treponema sp.]|nr:4Fe-4S binding protein [Treponema sp.]
MNKTAFEKALKDYIQSAQENYVPKEIALRPDLAGMRIFDEPLVGYASAADPFFEEAKKPGIIGAHLIAPGEWLAGAKTVISLFLPFTSQVREANRKDLSWPADEWLHARIEGQAFQNKICRFAEELLKKEGSGALAPMIDSRYKSGSPIAHNKTEQDFYTSNWSERHAAWAAGLGTFGLSKGLISRKGVAGRYLSVITGAAFEPDKRPYTGIYDYCLFCGACARNCPAAAISVEKGKMHYPCSEFLDSTRTKHAPRYGCGKCQVKVPCEDRAPKAGR